MNERQSSQTNVYDAILIGAGGAGMCLLYAMYETGYLSRHKVLVIEPNKNDSNNRTWCFWSRPDEEIVEQLGGTISAEWESLLIEDKIKSLFPYCYYHIRSLDFYNFVYEKINHCIDLIWVQDEVNGVEKSDIQGYDVSTTNGLSFNGGYVFDSRLEEGKLTLFEKSKHPVWQSFFGYRIRLNDTIISKNELRLMDFSVEQNGFCQFIYVLPFSNDEALVELTRFGSSTLNMNDDEGILHQWIQYHYGNYTILESEEGKLPMTLVFNPEEPYHHLSDKYIQIGTAAGSLKSTTGYAFKSMFNHAFAITNAINTNTSIPKEFHSPRFTFYDKLLLKLLAQRPYIGKKIFTSLFIKMSPGQILRFLEERSNLVEEIPLLLALPTTHFIWALLQKNDQ